MYEQDRFSPETAALMRYAFTQIDPVPVYIAPGNLDWYGPQSLYQQVDWSPNVHIFRTNQLSPVTLTEGFTLWGAAHCAPAGTQNFLSGFQVDRGGVHIGVFHGSAMGLVTGESEEKFPHAPFEMRDVETAGLNHLFVGHYHQPHEAALYTYPGSPHLLSFGEREGGAVVATVTDQGSVQREWQSVANFPFHDLEADVTGCLTHADIQERVGEAIAELRGVARVTVRGELPAELDFNPRDLSEVGHSLEGLLVRIGDLHPVFNFEAIAKEPTVRGQFVRDVLATEMETEKRNRVLVTGLRALDGRRDLEVVL